MIREFDTVDMQENLKLIRKLFGLTQREFASITKLARTTVVRLETKEIPLRDIYAAGILYTLFNEFEMTEKQKNILFYLCNGYSRK